MKDNLKELGLSLIENFITEEEEKFLLSMVPKGPVQITTMRNSLTRYGSAGPYAIPAPVSENIPDWIEAISDKIMAQGLLPSRPDSITVNEFLPGNELDYHIDSKTSGDVITVLSIGGPAMMNLKKADRVLSTPLHARTLLQMRDEARWDWEHKVNPVFMPRYSIVFRCSTNE